MRRINILGSMVQSTLQGNTHGASWPGNQSLKGLAEYRLGNFEAAVEWQEKVLGNTDQFKSLKAQAQVVLAMSHWRMKKPEPARAMLARGATLIEQKPPGDQAGLMRWEWTHWIAAEALHREARQLIEGRLVADPSEKPEGP